MNLFLNQNQLKKNFQYHKQSCLCKRTNKIVCFTSFLKPIFIFNLFFFLTIISAETIATVNSYEISLEQLHEKMQDYEGDVELSFFQIRDLALKNLINEQIVIIYAEQNGITVDGNEVESYFINLLGNDPKLLTNGEFDYQKFKELKKTTQVKKILTEMRRDILISKTESLIKSKFDISDENLLQQFIMENAEVDICYALINVNAANVPVTYSPVKAFSYYQKNKRNFLSKKEIKLRFFVITKKEFQNSVNSTLDELIEPFIPDDSTASGFDIDSLKFVFRENEINRLCRNKADEMKELADIGYPIPYPMLETGFLKEDDSLGKIPDAVIKKAFEMRKNHFSEPVELDIGFLIFEVTDIRKPRKTDLKNVYEKVWKSYSNYEKSKPITSGLKNYFRNNIDQFIIPAAYVEKIFIPYEDSTLISKIRNNFFRKNELKNILEEYDLQAVSNVIYLDKFSNSDQIDEKIAQSVNNEEEFGIIKEEDQSVFYNISSYFPEFIPDYDDIKFQIHNLIVSPASDSSDFREYYESHIKNLTSPDSLQIGGVFIPFETDSIEISENLAFSYYQDNMNLFYRDRSIRFEYIFQKDERLLDNIYDHLLSGYDFETMQFCFSEDHIYPQDEIISLKILPPEIQNVFLETPLNDITEPVYTDNGWFIFRKLEDYAAGIPDFLEIENTILEKLKLEEAKKIAELKAESIFDSTTYFSNCYQFADDKYIFRSNLLDANSEFDKIGSIAKYKSELLRLWNNEKYSGIITTNNGFAVIFLLQKRTAKQLTYEEALPKIKEIFNAKKCFDTANKFTLHLRNKIISGADPDSLLFFFGGWKKEEHLTFENEIPGIEISQQILEDISKRNEGYFSPIIKISDELLMFYHIERMQKISREAFVSQKDKFKKHIIEKEFTNWLNEFKSKIEIKTKF